MWNTLRRHWPEYLMEAAGLGLFMIAAAVFSAVLGYPDSPIRQRLPSAFARSAIIAVAMGLTLVLIIYSPWGRRSGAHINPAITLTFYRLRKIAFWDAGFYIVAQFLGGAAGLMLISRVLGPWLRNPPVNYIVTVPGKGGWAAAFSAEFLMSFGLMLLVLMASNSQALARFTGVFAGLLLVAYIPIGGPVSGVSLNPARWEWPTWR